MPEQIMKCKDCGNEFSFGERDQKFYEEQNFTPPKRCRPCRQVKKKQYNDNG